MDSWSKETNSPSEDMNSHLVWLNRARKRMWAFCSPFSVSPSYVIYFPLDHPSPTLVSHLRLYLSTLPIGHSFWYSVSCGDPDSTVQESCPHKWGQDVSCGYLMRRWQLILELLFHYSPMAVSLHLWFPLGRSGRLPLVACHFLPLWSRFIENKIALDNVSWQFGPSSFVLRHFFLLGMGLRLDMKWARVAKSFGPTINIFWINFFFNIRLFAFCPYEQLSHLHFSRVFW